MDTIAHIIYVMATCRFLFVAAAMVLMVLGLSGVAWSKGKVTLSSVSGWIAIVLIVCVIGSVVNVLIGSYTATVVVYNVGEKGTAKITGSHRTGSRYNHRDVRGYNVLIRTSENAVVESYFEDDYFNVYPPSNQVWYPPAGVVFTVHYLRSFPGDFVIISNDDSPWASSLRCMKLIRKLNEAKAKYYFDTAKEPYRLAYIDAIHEYIDGKCYASDGELQAYYHEVERANAKKKSLVP